MRRLPRACWTWRPLCAPSAQPLEASQRRPPSACQAQRRNARIVNFLNIGAPQQVMLEVKIAEVSKSLLDQLEAGTLNFGGGSWASTLSSNFVSGT
jgi:pilus assembly protein CpaC